MTKVAMPGTQIDVPMHCKDALYVRSHYDGMTLMLPDAPHAGRNRADPVPRQPRPAERARRRAALRRRSKGENGLV